MDALKQLLHASLQRFGFDLRRIERFGEPSLADFLRSREIDLVLDVGANEGQFALNLRTQGYSGEIVSFEPIASSFRKLATNTARDRKWTARQIALGDRVGSAQMNVTSLTVFSSFVPQAEMLRDWHPGTAVVAKEEVEIATLDSIFHPFHARCVFLKIDTQGFEQQVLEGAQDALRSIRGVQLELPIVHFYERTWSLADAIRYMDNAGFTLAQIHPVVHLKDDRVSLGEVDCVFRRTR